MIDVLLVRFRWTSVPDPVTALRALVQESRAGLGDATALEVHRAVEGDAGYAYVTGADDARRAVIETVFPDAEVAGLQRLVARDGASAGRPIGWHYVVETDVLPEMEDDFNAWYDVEHLPGLAAVPGTVRAARYRSDAPEGPRYHACYGLETLTTFGSPPWLAVRATDWSSRVRSAFRNTRRTMFRRIV